MFFVLLSFGASGVVASEQKLKVAILATGPDQMQVYSNLFAQYESSTGTKVEPEFYSDINFKKHIRSWIELGTYDLLYWQGGKRLEDLVHNGEIVPFSDLLDVNTIKLQYPQNALDAVVHEQQIYALPLGHYIWGFYYNKEVFNALGLVPPETWSEFKLINEALKKNGIKPLVQPTVDEWPVLAWLDYLSLNIGGKEYRDQLIAGNFGDSTNDERLTEAFQYLVSEELFFAPEHAWNWEQPIVSVVRKQAAMTLSGQFIEGKTQQIGNDKVGYFPFPRMNSDMQRTEVAPMELLVVPTSSTNHALTATLLEFLINYTAIDATAYKLGWLSVSNQPSQSVALSSRTKKAQAALNNATQLVQYFDRDAPPKTSSSWAQAITKSISSGEVSHINALKSSVLNRNKHGRVVQFDDDKLLSFSTIRGLKGTFYVSKILTEVYTQLGYSFHVNRFEDSAAVINSLRFAADGDLVRASRYSELEELAIKVPEPIAISRVILVGKKGTCAMSGNSLPAGASLGYKGDVVVMHQLAEELQKNNEDAKNTSTSWLDFERGKLDYLLIFETDLHSKRNIWDGLCTRNILDIPVFHYLANKHADIVDDVASALKQFKTTPEYLELSQQYGVRTNKKM